MQPGAQHGTNDVDEARQRRSIACRLAALAGLTDIANGIVFLASDDAGFMTGSALVVDGGTTAQVGPTRLENGRE